MSIDYRLDWRNTAENKSLSHTEWNKTMDWLESEYTEITTHKKGYKTNRSVWLVNRFVFAKEKRTYKLYTRDEKGGLHIFYTHADEEKNGASINGFDAITMVNQLFTEQNDISIYKAFGTQPRLAEEPTKNQKTNELEYHYYTEKCVEALPAIIQFDNRFAGLPINIYKADVSSAYPYQLTLPLPDANGARLVKGAVEPTENEVAFWLRSGHTIEGRKGGADTRKFLNHELYGKRHKMAAVPENEYTLLMPYSTYSLKDVIQKMYDKRKEDEEMKTAMVKCIGMMRSRRDFQHQYMGHIVAVVYARHITAMCQYYDTIKSEGSLPIMFATDSIIWAGKPSKAAAHEKQLGAFVSEYENSPAIMYGCGVYAIQKGDKIALVKHQGFSAENWKSRGRELHTLEDFKYNVEHLGTIDEYFDMETRRFIKVENTTRGLF